MASNAFNPQSAADKAVSVIGFGYDICKDIRFSSCNSDPSGSRLIELDPTQVRDLILPGGVILPDVPASIKCDKGERTRFRSDVLSFNQVFFLSFIYIYIYIYFSLGGSNFLVLCWYSYNLVKYLQHQIFCHIGGFFFFFQ